MDALLNHIKCTAEFLKVNVSNFTEETRREITKGQLQQLIQKVAGLQELTPEGATSLTKAMQGTFFTDQDREAWATAVSNRLIGCTTAMSKGRRPNQKVEDFSSYLTPTDVAVLAGEGNLYTKLETLVSRCLAVGMTIPSETSIRQILAAGIAAGINQGESKDQLAMVQETSQEQSQELHHNIHVAIYPSDPKPFQGRSMRQHMARRSLWRVPKFACQLPIQL